MSDVITIRAKTIEEAVSKASEHLKISPQKIQFEVIDEGYRGLFRKRPAIIQVFVRKSVRKEEESPTTVDILSAPSKAKIQSEYGTVWVKDGKIFCKNGSYQYAMLTPCDGLTLTVNGQAVTGTTIVAEEDVIDLELHNHLRETKISLTVSEDQMQVLLEIVPGYSITRSLKDMPPSRELTLEVMETRTVKTSITEEMVYQELEKIGVKMGIEHDEIKRACRSREPIKCVIAKGYDPIPGRDGVFELVSQKRREEKEQFIITDTVDWKERFSLPSVQAGEVIGYPVAAKPGVNGWNVFGHEVPAPEVKELTVLTGTGTILHGENRKLVATEAGRIKITQHPNNTLGFSIIPQYVHNDNVNIRTGNIRFHGDVFILGNVEDGMIVEAGGNLHILGRVSNATVRTGGDSVINGAVTGSTIICGYSNLVWDNMLPHFKSTYELIIQLINAIRQLESNKSFSRQDIAKMGLQPLIKLLTEVKFKELPSHIRKISGFAKNDKEIFDSEMQLIVDFLEKAFLYFHPLVSDLGQMESLVARMESIIFAAEFDSNKKMNINVQSLTNSKVISAWDVEVERFCYGSNIQAKGTVRVKEQLRGGQVEAGHFVKVKEIGSISGSSAVVWVTNSDGYVQADQVWPDTMIRIAQLTKKFIHEESSVFMRINDQGSLVLR
ncbi:flagellar assembly protein A [Effusibacillus consociatus]|uniref:Flagellar assembly protein A n=1 Tax=Effusibacillus consociatus TaxID=1117041 RepID=A0ABV9Q2J7_9BACL